MMDEFWQTRKTERGKAAHGTISRIVTATFR
jgi:hypothetical protein